MPKKKRGGKKEKKVKKKPGLNERESLSYEQQILDNNKQLSRLRSRNEELENEILISKEKLKQLEEDRSDVVAHLKRKLEENIEESRELSERLLALEELRKEEQKSFKKKEESMELEYRTMESNLSAEVKLATGKLNSLEDWRLARLDLMKKFELQEERIEEQEKSHAATLYEAEKALITGKAKMQKEMEKRLDDLAQSFKEVMNIRIAEATHRIVRENISLNEELDCMIRICRKLESEIKEQKEYDRMVRLQANLSEEESKIAMKRIEKQNSLVVKLTKEHIDMNMEYARLKRNEQIMENRELMSKELQSKYSEAEKKIRILEQNLQKSKEKKEEILNEIVENNECFNELNSILKEAAECVMEALQVQERVSQEDVCTSCYVDVKHKLLTSLLNILEKRDHYLPQQWMKLEDQEMDCRFIEADASVCKEENKDN